MRPSPTLRTERTLKPAERTPWVNVVPGPHETPLTLCSLGYNVFRGERGKYLQPYDSGPRRCTRTAEIKEKDATDQEPLQAKGLKGVAAQAQANFSWLTQAASTLHSALPQKWAGRHSSSPRSEITF